MIQRTTFALWCIAVVLCALPVTVVAQQPPYDVFPPADPPYYRVRYEASTQPGELIFPVNYTIWIPQDVKTLRGVIVHQHGCGEGSCKSGLTGAYDLHWQALAKKHDCALLAPSYEQPEKADCQMWCDPRNGSDAAFQKCLVDLGAKSGHPELAKVPWALWGHSGGGHWAGGMVLLHPDRVAAAWLRSGVPLLKANPERPTIKAHTLPDAALQGADDVQSRHEGRRHRQGRPLRRRVAGERSVLQRGARQGRPHRRGRRSADQPRVRQPALPRHPVARCLPERSPAEGQRPIRSRPCRRTTRGWPLSPAPKPSRPRQFAGDPLKAAWLPNEAIAQAWMQYVKDTAVTDTTPPPAPTNVRVSGNELTWEAEADLESGLASFIIERDGQFLANCPEQGKNPFGRPIFQNLQYSDTPTQPLVPMRFTDTKAEPGKKHTYRVIAVNTVGIEVEAHGKHERKTVANAFSSKDLRRPRRPEAPRAKPSS